MRRREYNITNSLLSMPLPRNFTFLPCNGFCDPFCSHHGLCPDLARMNSASRPVMPWSLTPSAVSSITNTLRVILSRYKVSSSLDERIMLMEAFTTIASLTSDGSFAVEQRISAMWTICTRISSRDGELRTLCGTTRPRTERSSSPLTVLTARTYLAEIVRDLQSGGHTLWPLGVNESSFNELWSLIRGLRRAVLGNYRDLRNGNIPPAMLSTARQLQSVSIPLSTQNSESGSSTTLANTPPEFGEWVSFTPPPRGGSGEVVDEW